MSKNSPPTEASGKFPMKSKDRTPRTPRTPPMTRSALANWGTGHIAYVRPARQDGINGYAVHTADGREMGFAATRDLAAASVRQHNLYPLSVH